MNDLTARMAKMGQSLYIQQDRVLLAEAITEVQAAEKLRVDLALVIEALKAYHLVMLTDFDTTWRSDYEDLGEDEPTAPEIDHYLAWPGEKIAALRKVLGIANRE